MITQKLTTYIVSFLVIKHECMNSSRNQAEIQAGMLESAVDCIVYILAAYMLAVLTLDLVELFSISIIRPLSAC